MYKLKLGNQGLEQAAKDEELLADGAGPLALTLQGFKPLPQEDADEEINYEWDLDKEEDKKEE